ncbi:MAG: hypothetical protein Q7U04_15635, partial [Bacteriovorax sp.]|nr:hypothetical protein [Bacteriovorax sp.]
KKINLSISINESSIDNKTLRLEWISSEELKDFSVRVSEDFTFKKFSDISTQSPAKIPWDKPVAFVKVMAINKLAQQVQSAPLKVYSITKIEKAKGRNNDQDFSSRIVNLFNKMLENSNKGKK